MGLVENSEEARSVYKIELVFADNGEEEYIPVWYYEMEDGRTLMVRLPDYDLYMIRRRAHLG